MVESDERLVCIAVAIVERQKKRQMGGGKENWGYIYLRNTEVHLFLVPLTPHWTPTPQACKIEYEIVHKDCLYSVGKPSSLDTNATRVEYWI